MKTLLTIVCIALFAFSAKSQCVVPPGFVCITQSNADQISKDLKELKDSRVVIAAFQLERTTTANQITALNNLVTSKDALETALRQQIVDMTTVHELAMKTLTAYAELVDKMAKEINKPQSAWSKFGRTLEKIAILAAGIYIGGL